MTTRISYSRRTGLAPIDLIKLVVVSIQYDSVLCIPITFNSKGYLCSVYILADGSKFGIFLRFSHVQIDRCIIALRIICRRCNYANNICARLADLTCGNCTGRVGKILANKNTALTVPYVHVVLDSHTRRLGRLRPTDLEAIAYFNRLVVLSGYSWRTDLTFRDEIYCSCFLTIINNITVFIQRIHGNFSFTNLVKHVTSCILDITAVGVLIPINHIKLIFISIQYYTVFCGQVRFYSKLYFCAINICCNAFYIWRFFFQNFNPYTFSNTGIINFITIRIVYTHTNIEAVLSNA